MAVAPARRAPAPRPARASAAPAPARRSIPAPGPRPAPRPGPRRAPARRGAALVRPRGAAVLDALLSGRGWIGLVFVLLAGIVFFNVDLLQMNREIASTAEHAGSIKRENARLRSEGARLGSTERIQAVAAEAGLVMPAPGDVRYLRSHGPDGGHAARALAAAEGSAPTPAAAEVPETTTDPAAVVPVDPASAAADPEAVPVDPAAVEPAPVAVEPATEPALPVAEP